MASKDDDHPDRPDDHPDDTAASRRIAYNGDELRRARQLARLSQTELGRRVGVDGRRVRAWEAKGITHGAHTLAAVEQVLGLGEAAPKPFDVTSRSTLELVTQLHVIAAELAARHLRDTGQQEDDPAVKMPERPYRVPRVVDLPRAGNGEGKEGTNDE